METRSFASRYYVGILTGVILLACLPPAAAAEDGAPIKFGLLPFLSAGTLVKKFDPLIKYLEQELDRPVHIAAAPDFKTYIERARDGHYDVYLAAPHISAYLEETAQARRVSRFARNLKGYFVVRINARYDSLTELRGQKLASPDPLAVITLIGERALVDAGLDHEADFVRHYTTHNNALRLVASGEQDCAVVGVSSYDNIPEPIKQQLRVLDQTAVIPHMMFHARKDLPEADYQAVKSAMLKFTADGAGEAFFKQAAFGDMAPITDAEIAQVHNLVELVDDKMRP